jgi:MFS family permease
MSSDKENRNLTGPAETARRLGRRILTAPTVGRAGALKMPSLPDVSSIQLPDALRNNPNYRRFFFSQFVSLCGTWMQGTASSLVILTLTTSAIALGAINVASALPMLLLSLVGGVLADRFDRRRIMLTSQAILGTFSIIYAVLVFSDRIEYWHILVIATLSGVVASFDLPAGQAFIPELVSRDDLPGAVALGSASFNSARIVGPTLASVAIGLFGLGSAFLINAATLIFPMSALVTIGKTVPKRKIAPSKSSGFAYLKIGVKYVREHDDMKGLMLLTALCSFVVFPNVIVLMPLYLTDALGGGDKWVGIGLAVLGSGSLIGAILLLRGSRREAAAGKRQRSAIIGLTVALVWLALAPNPLVAMIGVFIAGYSFATFNTQITTRIQQLAPDEMRGRLLSINSLAFNGVMPFSTITVSIASQFLGQKVVMGICAVLVAGGCYLIYKRFAWKAFTMPEPVVANPASL